MLGAEIVLAIDKGYRDKMLKQIMKEKRQRISGQKRSRPKKTSKG
jgi:hypothetical protein